jgi:hypothetical protein
VSVPLDHVRQAAGALWAPEVLDDWLTTPNRRLGGACPVDVVTAGRGDEVLAVIEAHRQGAYG